MALIERSSNPAFGSKLFEGFGGVAASQAMTVQGTVNKSLMMFGLLLLPALYTYTLVDPAGEGMGIPALSLGGAIGGFIVAMFTIFRPQFSNITAPLYAILEGFFLGGITAVFDSVYPGIGFQAILLTFGTLFSMLFMYKAKIIRVTERLRSGIFIATGAIFFLYLIGFIMSFFGSGMTMLHNSGPIGIGFSLLVVGIAAFNLLLDFDFIEKGARHGLPKYMEWYGAFGLMVTLVWLYMEFLRLLSKLRD